MKILLMGLPFYKFMGSHNNDPRLGLGYLSVILRKAGHEVYQFNPDYGTEYASQKELFERESDFIKDINTPYHPIYIEIFKLIDDLQPDVVGFSILAGTVIQSEIIAKYCTNQGIRTIVGGPMVTLGLDQFINNTDYGQLVPGEAETVITRVIDHPERKVVVGVPINNINHLPYVDRDNFINDTSSMFYGSVITTRGCPFKCKFCAHWLAGGEIRYRKPDNVMGELKRLIETYGQNYFRFFDETFTMNRDRIYKICETIKREELDITFLVETRVDCLDEDMIIALKEAGMVRAKLGVESGSPKILKIYKRGVTVDKVRNVVGLLKKHDIDVNINWMYGFEEETNEDLKASIDLATELEASWNTISCLSPYYGTDLYDNLPEAQKKNWKCFYHNMKMPPLNPDLDLDLINEFLSVNDRKRWVKE